MGIEGGLALTMRAKQPSRLKVQNVSIVVAGLYVQRNTQ